MVVGPQVRPDHLHKNVTRGYDLRIGSFRAGTLANVMLGRVPINRLLMPGAPSRSEG